MPITSNFSSDGVKNRDTKNRGPRMAVKSFQDFRQISQSFSYSELRNSPRNGTKVYYLYENKEMW